MDAYANNAHTTRTHARGEKIHTDVFLKQITLLFHALRTAVVARRCPVDGTTTVQYRSSPTCADGQRMS